MNNKNLFLILTTAFLLIATACSGGFIDPGMIDQPGGGYGDGSGGGYGGGSYGGGYGGGGSSGSSGTLTITGIPSQYNGKYVLCAVSGEGLGKYTIGWQNWQLMTIPQISNGKINIPLWTTAGTSYVGFSGNGKFGVSFGLYNSNRTDDDEIIGGTAIVIFSEGKATISWSDVDFDP